MNCSDHHWNTDKTCATVLIIRWVVRIIIETPGEHAALGKSDQEVPKQMRGCIASQICDKWHRYSQKRKTSGHFKIVT